MDYTRHVHLRFKSLSPYVGISIKFPKSDIEMVNNTIKFADWLFKNELCSLFAMIFLNINNYCTQIINRWHLSISLTLIDKVTKSGETKWYCLIFCNLLIHWYLLDTKLKSFQAYSGRDEFDILSTMYIQPNMMKGGTYKLS